MARRRHMAGNILRRLLYGICLIGCGCLLNACATTRGAGAERTETINTKLDSAEKDLDEAEQAVDRSSATPEEKKIIKEKIESGKIKVEGQKPAVSQLGADVDTNKKIADSNAAAAHDWHWVLAIGGGLLLASGAFAIKRFLL